MGEAMQYLDYKLATVLVAVALTAMLVLWIIFMSIIGILVTIQGWVRAISGKLWEVITDG